MNFLFVCGGTGGHINPALAVASRLRQLLPDAGFLFVGTGREMEKKLIPPTGFALRSITVTGVSRGLSPASVKHNLHTAKNLLTAARESEALLKEFRPDVVIGTGGYVCYPVLSKAAAMGIPTVLHESNALPGLTTKMLSGKVDRILTAFPGLEKQYKHPERVTVTGTPVRAGFAVLTKEEARDRLKLPDLPLVVSFWGSLGASGMNACMPDFIRRNCREHAFFHIHGTGGGEAAAQKLRAALEDVPALETCTDVRPYIHDMDVVMTAADVVLCRAGASTIAELSLMGKPAVLVPSPNVTDNHQEKNARAVERAGGAVVLLEKECTGEKLYSTVADLLRDGEKLAGMAAGAAAAGNPQATDRIAEIVLSLTNP